MKIRGILIIGLLLVTGSGLAGEIAPRLVDHMENLNDQDLIKVLVVLQQQADIKSLDRELHQEKAALPIRHESVIKSLRNVAQNSQKDILNTLDTEKSKGRIAGFTPHWIINAIVVKGTVGAIRDLAGHPDVKIIEPDMVVEIIEPVMVKTGTLPREKDAKNFIAPGVIAIGSNRVWNELGIDGTGTLVANMDSGVDGSHPALASRWRGNTADPATAWQDIAEVGSPSFPVDIYGHGTHVMGTITGGTAFEKIGVAPGAQWIATNTIASSIDNFDNGVIAGFEWIADPDGNPDTHDDVPDVCHNSWGVVTQMGYPPCYSDWWSIIDNCEAAGVVLTFSAGNEGPTPGSLRSPGDRATSPTNCFTIGSTGTYSPNTVSTFSSRGPSVCGGDYQIKPEIMAPGEDIISSFPGGSYGYMSGTSMAGPHVAGVVALMRQAAPDLDVTTIKEVLMETAIDLGAIGEDNNYGHGIVDAYAAVTTVMNNVGKVSGVITDLETGLPLADVTIWDTRGLGRTTTGDQGDYSFTILAGSADLEISLWGYNTIAISLEIPAGEERYSDFTLVSMPSASILGTVFGPDELPLEGVEISVLGTQVSSVLSDAEGHYEFHLPSGPEIEYQLMALPPNLAYELVYVGLSTTQTVDFHLPELRNDGFESGGLITFPWQTAGAQPWSINDKEAVEGVLSVKTGIIGHNEESELALDFYVNGDGNFSFHYKVDSEVAYDRLLFYLDNNLESTWSGSINWSEYSTSLKTGWHQFRWVYTKDSDVSVGMDAAWIDLVSMPGTGVQQAASISFNTTELNQTIDAGVTETVQFQIGNNGGFPLEFEVLGSAGNNPLPLWLEVSPSSGIIYPGNEAFITLSLFSLQAGTHVTDLVIGSNDPVLPESLLHLTLTVDAVSAVDALPRQLSLLGAVPNPFNPNTTIKFNLPNETRVNMRIYDVAGRPVRTLVSQTLSAGQHSVNWDGKNESGQNVASGMYFTRLQTTTGTRMKPMVLVR